MDWSPPGSSILGIFQARVLEWGAISFSKSESCSVVSDSSRPHGLEPTRLLHPWDFPGKSTGVGCHHLFRFPTKFGKKKSPVECKDLTTVLLNGCLLVYVVYFNCPLLLSFFFQSAFPVELFVKHSVSTTFILF